MNQKRIAIACQGGGSQCAFVAGVLKTFLQRRVHDTWKIVGLSGTSGGALTAALAWSELLKEAHGGPPADGEGIIACWKDLTAQTPQEVAFDRSSVEMLRLTERGFLPSFAMSPASPQFRILMRAIAFMIGRPEFTDLRALIVKHLDFDALPSLVDDESPVLLVGAADVLEGTFKIFSSARGEISPESLLASAAVPNLFPAVWVDGHAYWDGIFSTNPPVAALFHDAAMGGYKRPQELWIVQVNRSQVDSVPERPSDIVDRRNHLAGNLSMQHELSRIATFNLVLKEGGLTEQFRARIGLYATEPITVRYIRMSEALYKGLDYPSKLSRQPAHISRLIADGETQADAFLAQFLADEQPSPGEEAAAAIH
jgi:NTE family protein